MTKDNCGWPTHKGTACKHPATEDNGRCWLHADDDRDMGRPSTFTDALAREAIEAASDPLSKAGIARAIGVPRTTLVSWLDQELEYVDEDGDARDFSSAFMRARREPERLLTRGPLVRPDEVDGQHARFLLSTSFGYVKTERREVTGEDGSPLEVVINDSIREVTER